MRSNISVIRSRELLGGGSRSAIFDFVEILPEFEKYFTRSVEINSKIPKGIIRI
jgi:hypothetical protein